MILGYPGGSNVITRSLKVGSRSERRCDFRSRGQRASLEDVDSEGGRWGHKPKVPVARKGKETEPPKSL